MLTYSLFSLDTGDLIEAYSSEDAALALAARMVEQEPEARDLIGLVVTDADGSIVSTASGEALLHTFAA